jgi:hypothetical protein
MDSLKCPYSFFDASEQGSTEDEEIAHHIPKSPSSVPKRTKRTKQKSIRNGTTRLLKQKHPKAKNLKIPESMRCLFETNFPFHTAVFILFHIRRKLSASSDSILFFIFTTH